MERLFKLWMCLYQELERLLEEVQERRDWRTLIEELKNANLKKNLTGGTDNLESTELFLTLDSVLDSKDLL